MSGTHSGRHNNSNNRSVQINQDQLESIMKEHMTQNGDGTGNKLGVIADALNTNTITQNGKIDTTNTKLDTLETTLTALETDAAASEVLLTTLSNGQTQNGDGSGNKLGVMIDAINTNTITGNGKIDTTNSKLATIEADIEGNGTVLSAIDSVLDTIKVDTGAIKTAVELLDNTVSGSELQVDIVSGSISLPSGAATEAKQDVIETTLTAIETDAAAIEVLITATNSKIDTFDAVLDSSLVKQTAIETLITSTNSKIDTLDAVQDAAEVHLGNIETAVQLLDDTVKAEDAAHSSGDKGLHVLGVRNDTLAALAGADGDYASLQVDKNGGLYTNKTSGNNDLTFTGSTLVIPNNATIYTDAIDVSQYSHYVIALNSADSSFTGCNVGIEYSPDNGTSFMGSKSSGASLPESVNAEALYKPSGGGSGAALDSYGLFLGEGLQMSMTNPVRKASHIRVFVQAPNSGSTITLSKFSIFLTN